MPMFLILILGILGVAAAVLAVIFIIYPLFKFTARGIGWLFTHVFAFVGGMFTALLRAIGALFASVVFIPLILVNIIIGRWSAASHFGRSLQDEIAMFGRCCYRFFVGHPARFLLLTPLLEGIERSVPDAVAHAPGPDRPNRRTGQFPGYTIVGSLKGGGSGGRLFVAEPDEKQRAIFARRGQSVDQVVIKSFSLADGSSLPQIIRESRALESARKMGLILDHELTDKRFFYVMPFVPGDMLSVATNRLHDQAGPAGLKGAALDEALGYVEELVGTLETYHRGGLWHKDVKPDNIIVSGGRAHLVDLGLVTPLRSAMTLTTHGTEYFRDPEMVRLALKGVKVHEVNGAKFDIYAAGAVLYSVIERSFPAHGGLSQITRACPESLRWVIRRAMAEYDKRYEHAGEMLADLRAIRRAPDPFALRPAELPSMKGGAVADVREPEVESFDLPPHARPAAHAPGAAHAGPAASPSPEPARAAHAGSGRPPRIRVDDWLTGRFSFEKGDPRAGAAPFVRVRAGWSPAAGAARAPARDQLRNAQRRVREAQARVTRSRAARMGRSGRYSTQPNAGIAAALLIFFAVAIAIVALVAKRTGERSSEWAREIKADIHADVLSALADIDTDVEDALDDAPEIAGLEPLRIRIERVWAEALATADRARSASRSAPVPPIAPRAPRGTARVSVSQDGRIVTSNAVDLEVPEDPTADAFAESILRLAALDQTLGTSVERLRAALPPERFEQIILERDATRERVRTLLAGPSDGRHAEEPLGRWILVNDVAPGADPAASRWVETLGVVLGAVGAEVVGLTPGGEDEVALIARARAAMGVTPFPHSEDTYVRIASWLEDDAGQDVGGLIWVTKGESPGEPQASVVCRPGAGGGEVVQRVVDAFASR